ncbi:class A beta-lactamase Bla1 [Rugosimonospora acidiphila]|uniref:Beta-lactamase n=1 Tax=Rugosimonospora acidiphila TaxID=556531 RepID=A0ABP9RPG0_9ACTN
MRNQLRRLAILAALTTVAVAALTACGTSADVSTATAPAASATPALVHADQTFQALESEYGARLGVWALDTGSNRTVAWRADERFAYASTFKALAAGVVLRQDSTAQLAQVIHYTNADLVDYSPITEQHVEDGMTVSAICDAAIRYSDNTAGNLLFRELGGPNALGADLKKIGDDTIHVDRVEPDLNDAVPGDVRDTSTPRAMGTDLKELAVGNVLPSDKRTLLDGWLKGDTVGGTLIRAGVPAGWTVGDKSGAGEYGTRNDIAVVWPPNRAPIVLAIMSTRTTRDATYDDALIANAAKAVMGALAS